MPIGINFYTYTYNIYMPIGINFYTYTYNIYMPIASIDAV